MSDTDIRENIVNKIDTLINDPDISKNIEIGVFNSTIREADTLGIIKKWDNLHFKKLYILKIISIYANLSQESYIGNNYLINQVKDGKLQPYDIASLKPFEMFPERWKSTLDMKSKRDQIKFEKRSEIATNLYQCSKCLCEDQQNFYLLVHSNSTIYKETRQLAKIPPSPTNCDIVMTPPLRLQ